MSRFKDTSRPGNVSTCPRLAKETPVRTSKGIGADPKCVLAFPEIDIFPFDLINNEQGAY
jgi:hypothetical protein